MSLSEFNDRITLIESKYHEFFKERDIHSYYECITESFADLSVKRDALIFFENTDLPNHIREEIADAFADAFFE